MLSPKKVLSDDELRALADALEPMAKAPRFEDFGVPAFCAWLRACADARLAASAIQTRLGERPIISGWDESTFKLNEEVALYTHPAPAVPAGWKLVPVEPTREMIFAAQQYHEGEAYLPFSLYKSMLAAAPPVPQAEPIDPHMIVADDRFPDAQAEPKRQPVSEATALIEWPESAKWKNRAALEGIERSCVGEPKREPSCLWSRADDDTDVWETKCGHAFTIIDGTPTDNQMAFCCYCGRRVDEEIGGSDER